MKILDLLTEIQFRIYKLVVRCHYKDGTNIEDLEDMVRAIPGVLIVKSIGHDSKFHFVDFSIKLLTSKEAETALDNFRQSVGRSISVVSKLEINTSSVKRIK